MPAYLYACPEHGEFEHRISGDQIECPVCHSLSKRMFAVQFNKSSLKHQGRFDSVVGRYVANDREFTQALREGQAAQEAKLGMEVKLEQVDARDHHGLAELHGHSVDRPAEG